MTKLHTTKNFPDYESSLKPMTKEELIRRAKISNQNIKEGKTKSISQLKKESEKW